jgi:peptide/nickel transport system permease protein
MTVMVEPERAEGLDCRWLGVEETHELSPYLAEGSYLGSVFTPSDGSAEPHLACVAMGRAGFHGGKIDMLVMRSIDVILCFPSMVLAIMVVTFLGNTMLNLILVIGYLFTPGTARLIYGTTLAIKGREFVEASRMLGAKSPHIILKHILPNSINPLLVRITLDVGNMIITESGPSFLGLGPPPPTPSWGYMFAVGR